MPPVRPALFIAISALLIVVSPAASDTLWEKAVSYTADRQDFQAATVEMLTWQLDGDGGVKESSRLLMRRTAVPEESQGSPHENPGSSAERNNLRTTIIEAETNGTRQSKREIKKMEDRMNSSSFGSRHRGVDPFSPGAQEDLSYSLLEERTRRNSRECSSYRFTLDSEDAEGKQISYEGRAWIERESGRPVAVVYAPDPLPGPLSSFQAEHRYDTVDGGRWLLASVVVEAEARILFVHRHFITETKFSDYFIP